MKTTTEKLAISNAIPKVFEPTEARVERDGAGKILRVIHEGVLGRSNPLNDPLNSDSDSLPSDGEELEGLGGQNEIIKKLEEQASRGAPKKDRTQSEREREWIARLVGKWGDDFGAMFRDRRLNPMQQTERDIRRRVGKWRSSGGAEV
jgi:nucleolar protein 16